MQGSHVASTNPAPVPEVWLHFTRHQELLSFEQFRLAKRHQAEPYVYAWLKPDGLPFYIGSGVKGRAVARTRSRLRREIPTQSDIAVLPCQSLEQARALEAVLIRGLSVEWLAYQDYERALLAPDRVKRAKAAHKRQKTRSDAGKAQPSRKRSS